MSQLLLCSLLFLFSGNCLAAELFPQYPAIRTNVAFWEKIYSTYSINSAVIHDSEDLSKIYEVVTLLDENQPAANRINQAIVKLTIERYQDILLGLGRGRTASSVTEKRVAAFFKGPQSRQRMTHAAEFVRCQKGLKERFREGVIRSGAYMGAIRNIFRAHGLPSELAYLPHVESSFNNQAYSKVGAAGMWQFTRATGKQYMHIDDAIDERSDPFIAAEAAAEYLKNSYQKLGSWPLALTSYNYGTGGMVRARNEKGSYEKIFREYSEGHFGFASRNFYSEFLAAVHVARKLENIPGIRPDRPISFTEYRLPGYIHINEIKRHFRISDSTVKELNPAIRPPVFAGKQRIPPGYRLRLPSQKNTRNLVASLPRSYFSSRQLQEQLYKVKPGEGLGRIAAKHGVSLNSLLAANSLKRDSKILVGQRLRIPSASSTTVSGSSKPVFSGHSGLVTATGKQRFPKILTAEKNKIHQSSPQ